MAQKKPGVKPDPRPISNITAKGKSEKKQQRSKSSAGSAGRSKMSRAG
jgi:hypothetical protein